MSKRGLSQTVSTILLILLILIAIGGIWMVLNKFVFSETSKLNLAKFTINLKIKKVAINASSGTAEVRVMRDVGEGNVTAIKFIVKDTKSSEVFEMPIEDFVELSERTFLLNFSESGVLNYSDVYEISIAPVFLSPTTGSSEIGIITDTVGELGVTIVGIYSVPGDEGEEEIEGTFCSINSDCGTDDWVNLTEICAEDSKSVLQYKKIFTCALGFCTSTTEQYTKETCAEGTICFEGRCIEEQISCTNGTIELDCGVDGFVGVKRCATGIARIVQDYRTYSCIDSFCSESTGETTIQDCEVGEECFEGECFTPVECTQNSDCDFGEICEEGFCVQEVFLNNGTVRSAWPYNIGEYFDSFFLPSDNESTFDATGNYIIFPYSDETRCLKVREFSKPDFIGGISYIRLNETPTNISDDDAYQLWETDYACSLI